MRVTVYRRGSSRPHRVGQGESHGDSPGPGEVYVITGNKKARPKKRQPLRFAGRIIRPPIWVLTSSAP